MLLARGTSPGVAPGVQQPGCRRYCRARDGGRNGGGRNGAFGRLGHTLRRCREGRYELYVKTVEGGVLNIGESIYPFVANHVFNRKDAAPLVDNGEITEVARINGGITAVAADESIIVVTAGERIVATAAVDRIVAGQRKIYRAVAD